MIVLGKGVVVQSSFRLNPIGAAHPSLLDVRPGGMIAIGDGSGFSSPVISSRIRVEIGRNCMIGGGVKIMDHNFHSLDAGSRRAHGGDENPRPVWIGDDVFIGAQAIILKGTRIGARSIVAAGSVVFGLEVPPDSLVKGNPAVVLARRGLS